MNKAYKAESERVLSFFALGKEAGPMGKWLLTILSCAVVIIREIVKDDDD